MCLNDLQYRFSTKIITLPIAPVFFGVLCKFAMVPGVYIYVPTGQRGAMFFRMEMMYKSGSTLTKNI